MPGSCTSSRKLPRPRRNRASSLRSMRPNPIGLPASEVGTSVGRSCASTSDRGWLGRARRPSGRSGRCCGSRCSGTAGRSSASRMTSSLGSGSLSSSQRAVIIIPGVQNPHCSPWHSMNPCCTGSSPSAPSRPSTVSTVRPSAITPSTVQLFTGVPSRRTTHAPQLEVSQPQCVPVRPKLVADEVHEEHPRLDVGGPRLAVDGDGDVHAATPFARSIAVRSARLVSSPARWRL